MTTLTPSAVPQISTKRRIGFYLPLVLFMGLILAFTVFVVPILPEIVTGWFHEGQHQLHGILDAAFFLMLLVGFGVQFFGPAQQVGGMQQTIIGVVTLLIVMLVANSFFPPMAIFLALVLLAAAFHPARREIFNLSGNVNKYVLGLVAVAAVPAIYYAVKHIGLQAAGLPGDEHAEFNHWATQATIAFSILALGAVASLRKPGWRVPLYSAAALAFIHGLASVLLVGIASSTGMLWGVLTIIWAVALVATAEKTKAS